MTETRIGQAWLAFPWVVIALAVPLLLWWTLEPVPVVIEYVHPYFIDRDVTEREDAEKHEVKQVQGGAVVYRYIEYTVRRSYTARASRAWVTKAMVWNAPDFSTVLSHEPGHHHKSIAIDVPTSSPTRDMQFVQSLIIPINLLRTEEIEYPPIPLRVLSPEDAAKAKK